MCNIQCNRLVCKSALHGNSAMKCVVSIQNATESVTVRRWSRKTLHLCKRVWSNNQAVLQVPWFSDEAHFHLNDYINKKNIYFGPQGIQGILLPAHCIQKELHHGVHYQVSEYSVLCSIMVVTSHVYLILPSDEFVVLMLHGIPMN